MEVMREYPFIQNAAGQEIGSILQNKDAYENVGIILEQAKSSGENSRHEHIIPVRMDAFQNIVDIQWGQAVQIPANSVLTLPDLPEFLEFFICTARFMFQQKILQEMALEYLSFSGARRDMLTANQTE